MLKCVCHTNLNLHLSIHSRHLHTFHFGRIDYSRMDDPTNVFSNLFMHIYRT